MNMTGKIVSFVILLQFCASRTGAIPVRSCPATPQNNAGSQFHYYIPDTSNRCVFYWCFKGRFVRNTLGGFTFDCRAGFGTDITQNSDHASSNICSRRNFVCVGSGGSGGGVQTTTTTTTTPATPSQKQIVQFLPGYHALNGQQQPFINTLKECYTRCRDDVNCLAFDFNFLGQQSCWFHTANTVCAKPKEKENCVHYRFVRCATTTTVPSPTTTTASTTVTQPVTAPFTVNPSPGSGSVPMIQTFSGQHLLGGTRLGGMTTAYQCLSTCYHAGLLKCAGVDFDNRTNGCYVHNISTECTQFVSKPFCTHWRLTDQCTGSGAATVVPAVTTAAPATDATTGQVPTTVTLTQPPTAVPTVPPGAVPTGFVSRVMGKHLFDGVLLLTGASEQQCLDACLMSSFCLALDFNTITKECYAHNTTTYCDQPVDKPACIHYKRAPCLTGALNDIAEVRTKFHVPGGFEVCVGCSIEQCLLQCFSSLLGLCQGVDYDERNQGCYVHRATTVCNPLQAKDFCTHYTRVVCTTQPTVTVTLSPPVIVGGGSAAPTGPFMQINFMGPSVLPSGWSAYPGMEIGSGVLIAGPAVDGDACRIACENRPDCQAIDFNSLDGTCFGHLSATSKCDILLATNNVYHMKKPTICSVFTGTTVPYPIPFAVG